MSKLGTAFWAAILGGSVLAIGIGFASGSRLGAVALSPPTRAPLPAAAKARAFERLLSGPGSLDAGDANDDRFADADHAVASRPGGWAPSAFNPLHDRARIAILVVDADRSATALVPFVNEPFPIAVVVSPESTETLRAARLAGKTALVDCASAGAADITALRAKGAAGIACSTRSRSRARTLVAANGGGIVFDDLVDGDALYAAARSAHRRSLTRDVLADARTEEAYVDFLFAQGLAVARRTGAATIAVHARDASRRALERFAARAGRDGVDLVELLTLAG